MRMCGHAHHDDMLYLGKDPQPSWDYPPLAEQRLRDRELLRVLGGARSDRDVRRAARSRRASSTRAISTRSSARPRRSSKREAQRGDRRAVAGRRQRPAPACSRTSRRASRVEVLDPAVRGAHRLRSGAAAARSRRRRSIAKGSTFLEAVMLGVGDALRADPRVFVYGEDVGGAVRQRVPAAAAAARRSSAIASSTRRSPKARCSASASARRSPGSGRSARCSSTTSSPPASTSSSTTPRRSATAGAATVPMVVRMPWGGLRHAGPVSQPEHRALVLPHAGAEDRRAVDAARRARADGRAPSPIPIRCSTTSTSRSIAIRASSRCSPTTPPAPLPIGKAALRRAGDDLAIISYGAYVHVALRVAETLAADGIEASVLDLRIARRRSIATRCSPSRATAAAC